MMFVWTLDSVIAVIIFGLLVLLILFVLIMQLIDTVIKWIQRRMPYKGDKTHDEESGEKK